MELVEGYLSEISKLMQELPVEEINKMVAILHEARLNNQQVFVMGNGGSAATATHFVCDLIKNTRVSCCPDFRVIGLADNMATFSAYGNDEGYDKVFSQQLNSLARAGDVVIGISTSGNSPNVLEAMRVAREKGAYTIGLTGRDGGKLGGMVDLNIYVPNKRPDQTEDVHLIVLHSVTAILREMARPTIVEEFGKRTAPVSGTAVILDAYGMASGSSLSSTGAFASADPILILMEQLEKEQRSLAECPELLGTILLHLTQGLHAQSGSFALIDENQRIVNAALVYSGKITNGSHEQMNEFIKTGLAGWAVKNRQPALLESTQKDRRWRERMQTGSLKAARSVLCVPLIADERVMGVITLSRPAANPFSGKEMLILTGVIAALTSRLGAKRS
jgi:D-sedoheptulose 7-phosphate isomerase